LELEESQIYGSSRLGIDLRKGEGILSSVTYTLFGTQNGEYQKGQVVVSSSLPGAVIRQWNRKLGYKNYELSNHLGNVLVTISDRKLPVQGNPLTTVSKYLADVVATNDYSAFGAPMVGRGFNSPSYRYGFNGKEKDSELGEGVTTAEFWEYDGKLGRRWNVDPVVKSWESPYVGLKNNPIHILDPNGDDGIETSCGEQLYESTSAMNMGEEINLTASPNNASLNSNLTGNAIVFFFSAYHIQTKDMAIYSGYLKVIEAQKSNPNIFIYTYGNSYEQPAQELENIKSLFKFYSIIVL
jgi:RHS repeat-associated protein